MIEFNLNKNFRKKDERKKHLIEKIGKKIAFNEEKGNKSSFFSVARRAIQEVMPADKFEAYATIAKTIEEKYGLKLTLGKDGNTDISTNRYGAHSWYIRFKEDTEEEKHAKKELLSQIEKLSLKKEFFENAAKEVFAPFEKLCEKYDRDYRRSEKYFSHLYVPKFLGYVDSIKNIEQLIFEVNNKIKESKIENHFGTPYKRWNSFYVYLKKYLKELKETKLKIETSENYIKYQKEYGKTNINELKNEESELMSKLESIESIPNTISIKDHFAVGQGDIQFADGDTEYNHYYQYKTIKNNYIDKTIILDFDNKNKVRDISLYFIDKAYKDSLGRINQEDKEYVKIFETLEEFTDYFKKLTY